MARIPHNVQARAFGTGYIAWNGAGAVFNVRQDVTSRTWRATAQRFACFYSAPSLRQLAMILERDTQDAPALVAPAGATPTVVALYATWNDAGRRDRAEWSGLT